MTERKAKIFLHAMTSMTEASRHGPQLLHYADVIVRNVPASFDKAITGENKMIDVTVAAQQHKDYVDAMKKSGAIVHFLPDQNELPDSVFVEDIAVIVGKRAVVTNPKPKKRKQEREGLAAYLEDQHGLEVSVLEANGGKGYLDGGDVIYTGKEIIAGKSERTDANGIEYLRKIFSGVPVVDIDTKGPLHLTTMIHLLDVDTFLISTASKHGQEMLDQINAKSKVTYSKVEVSSDKAANCVAINGHVLCKSEEEDKESFYQVQAAAGQRTLHGIKLSEIEKATGSLSCMSLRFNSNKVKER